MAVQTTEEFKNGGATSYAITIEYLKASDIKVRIGGALQTYVASSPSSGEYTVSGTTVTLGAQAAAGSGNVHIYRETDVNTAAAVFAAGSSIRAADLNAIHDMGRFAAVEHRNQIISADIKDDQILNQHIATDAVNSDSIIANAVGSSELADNAVDTAAIQTSAVTSAKIADGTIQTADIGADQITSALIADDQINSEHYAATSIDTEHIANENITTAKLAADAVTASKLADNAVVTANIVDANITNVKLANDAVNGNKIADDSINSEHYVDGSIDTVHIADNQITTAKIADGAITDAKIAGGSLDNRYYTETELDSGQLDNRYYTETESDARYFNISTGDTIKDGDTFPDNDTTIATTAAINDRIIDLIDDVGGFVPIANETSFPTSNPDVNNGTGTIVSVSAASTNLVPSGTTVTIANGRGSGLAVIITGVSATIPSGFGFLVETTTTAHTYTFHRLSPKATEVTTVSGIASNVTTVAGIASNVTAVAGNATDITAVAGNNTNISAVANNASNINAVAADASDIGVVAADGTDIGLVAGSIANVNTAATNIASINNASTNISSVNNFGDKYQISSSPPTTDGGGNALAEGDLYFDTTADELKVYSGSVWQGGVTASGNFASTTGNTFTGTNIHNDNAKSVYGTSSDGLEIFHNASDSVINDQGTGSLKLQTGGNTKVEITGTGTSVTGNIVVSGNVDGRDVAADGTKLDGISTGATRDLLQDVSPQLGGHLDVNGKKINTAISNGNIQIEPDGTGVVEIRGAGGNDGTLQLNCSQQSHGVKIKSPAHSANASYTLTLPTTDGNNHELLKSDGSGNLSWTTVGADNIASNAVTTAKIANNQVTSDKISALNGSKLVDASVSTAKIADNAITRAKITNGEVISAKLDSNAVTTSKINDNAVTTDKIANEAVTLAKLPHGTSSNDGKFLRANNGADPTFETVNTDLVADSSPQLGGDLDTNSHNISLDDDHKVNFGDSNDLQIDHHGTDGSRIISTNVGLELKETGGFMRIRSDELKIQSTANETYIEADANGAVQLFHDNSKKLETRSNGINVTGNIYPTGHVPLQDNQQVILGGGDDLRIYHNSSDNNSYIEEGGTGHLVVKADDFYVQNAGANHTQLISDSDADVKLSFNGTEKFQTTTDGAKVMGTGNFVLPSGTTAQRGSAATGAIRYNTTTNQLEVYNGSAWAGVGASSPQIYKVTNTTTTGAAGTSMVITGEDFVSGATVHYMGGDGTSVAAGSVAYNSATQLTAVSPALLVAGAPYSIKVTNPDGGEATIGPEIEVSAGNAPAWSTASGQLGSSQPKDSAVSGLSVAATDADGQAITYSEVTSVLTSNSNTPASTMNLSLNSSTGAITGTAPSVSSDTTYNFTLRATDTAGNTTDRAFSIVILAAPAAIVWFAGTGYGATGTRSGTTWSHTGYNPNASGGGNANSNRLRVYGNGTGGTYAGFHHFLYSNAIAIPTGHDKAQIYISSLYTNVNGYRYNQGSSWTTSQPSGNSHGSGAFGARNLGSHGTGLQTYDIPASHQGQNRYFQMFVFGGQNGVQYQEITLVKTYNVNNP